MNISTIKLVALFAMVASHISCVFGFSGWMLLPNSINSVFLYHLNIFAFVIFAFALINGWHYTKNKAKHFQKMVLFALLSQIPYSLAMATANRIPLSLIETNDFFHIYLMPGYYIIFIVVITLPAFFYALKKKSLHFNSYDKWLFVLTFFNLWSIRIQNIYLLTDLLNIFNLYVCAFLIIGHYESFQNKNADFKPSPISSIPFLLITLINADYHYGVYFACIILILLLYFTYHKKVLRCIATIFWAFVFYAIVPFLFDGNIHMDMVLIAAISALLLLFYQKEKIPYIKNFFYIFYPLHLFCIGIFSMLIKFNILNF